MSDPKNRREPWRCPNYIGNIYVRGGTCFTHGPYTGSRCPKWPDCASDQSRCVHCNRPVKRVGIYGRLTWVHIEPSRPEAEWGNDCKLRAEVKHD